MVICPNAIFYVALGVFGLIFDFFKATIVPMLKKNKYWDKYVLLLLPRMAFF